MIVFKSVSQHHSSTVQPILYDQNKRTRIFELQYVLPGYSSSSTPLFFFFLLLGAAPSFFWCTVNLVHDSSLSHSKPARTGSSNSSSCFFLNCLWMASNASLIVTPLRLRAVTSRPKGKWRSIFLTGGVVRNFFSASLSSMVDGEVFSFLLMVSVLVERWLNPHQFKLTSSAFGFHWQSLVLCLPSLSLIPSALLKQQFQQPAR